jgi:hypothetical protein
LSDAVHDLSPLAFNAFSAQVISLILIGTWLSMAPMKRAWIQLALALGAVTVVTTGLLSTESVPPGMLWATGVTCGMIELMSSVVLAAVVLLALRASAPSPDRALLAGLAAGATGIFFLHFHCTLRASAHLFLFHVAPWAIVAVGVAWLRQRVRSKSFAP